MVYAELKLERKVDWSTYPTTMPFQTMYWEDNKGYSWHVHPRVCGDQRDFGILEEETGRDYLAGLVK
jgi:hypothetical protein